MRPALERERIVKAEGLSLPVPPVASAHLAEALAWLRCDISGIDVVHVEDELRVIDAAGAESLQIRNAWHAAILGELVLERSRGFRERVHRRLFG